MDRRAFAAVAALAMAIITLSCGAQAEETDEGDGCGINGHIVPCPIHGKISSRIRISLL
jgi:hypothetical protein